MTQPNVVGDLIQLVVTYKPPPQDPTAKVTAASMMTLSPSGIETTTPGVEQTENVWRFIAPTRINEAGTWVIRVNANAGLIDSIEFALPIASSAFAQPLPA